MSANYRVTAPYVTLKVKDREGAPVVAGFYAGAVVSDVETSSLKHHLDHGLVEKVDDSGPDPVPEADPVPDDGGRGRKSSPSK